MTDKDAYKNLLRELDKYESPTFSVKDFNYFFNVAISEYITGNYSDFDVIQKDLDDIKDLVEYGTLLTFNGVSAPLPTDYRHCLGIEATIEFIEDTIDYGAGDTLKIHPQRMQTNRKGYADENAYQQPSYLYPTYMMSGNSVLIRAGESVTITTGTIDYIINPDVVALDPTGIVESELQFSEYVCLEIIKVCRQIFLENIESPRYRTSLQENELNKIKE